MKFIPSIEFEPPEIIKKFQDEKLKEALQYLKNNSKYYQNVFNKNNIKIEKINSVSDLSNIPFTTKTDLHNYNTDFLCVERKKIVDYITTSGTLGNPVTFAMTDKDLERLAYNEAISFTCAGGKSTDIYQLMTTIDKRFMAGLAYFLGIRKMGAGIIRVGNGVAELQWDSIKRFNPNTIIVVPSFILRIIKYAEDNGIDYKNSSIKKAVCIGENLRDTNLELNLLGSKIKEKWDIQLFSTYASTEMATTFCECEYGCGGHEHPELIITELVDDDGNVVENGQIGELCVTTLGVEGMPLLRFKTGDMAKFYTEKCKCGRTTKRISPIIGRKNQMIKFKGTTLFPSAIFEVLDNTDLVNDYYVEVSTNDIGTDDIEIFVSTNCETENNYKFVAQLKDKFKARLRVTPRISITSSDVINKVQGKEINRKPKKFIDKRSNNHDN